MDWQLLSTSSTLGPFSSSSERTQNTHKTHTWAKTRRHTEKQHTACAKSLLHEWIWPIKTFNPQADGNNHYPNHPGDDNKRERPENEDTRLKEPNMSTCRCTTKGADDDGDADRRWRRALDQSRLSDKLEAWIDQHIYLLWWSMRFHRLLSWTLRGRWVVFWAGCRAEDEAFSASAFYGNKNKHHKTVRGVHGPLCKAGPGSHPRPSGFPTSIIILAIQVPSSKWLLTVEELGPNIRGIRGNSYWILIQKVSVVTCSSRRSKMLTIASFHPGIGVDGPDSPCGSGGSDHVRRRVLCCEIHQDDQLMWRLGECLIPFIMFVRQDSLSSTVAGRDGGEKIAANSKVLPVRVH